MNREEAIERMEQDAREANQRVRNRTECQVCGDEVPDADFDTKYMAAGGLLAGPYCSEPCYWGALVE